MLAILAPFRGGKFAEDNARFFGMEKALADIVGWGESFSSAKARRAGFISAELLYDLQSLVSGFRGLVRETKRLMGDASAPVPAQCIEQDALEPL